MSAGDAILFPGQGSQHDAMREQVARLDPRLLELATRLVGADPFEHLADGTRFVQPAVFCASVVSWRATRDAVAPIAFAGHSLGEYGALVAAGAVDAADALELVALRGSVSQEVAARREGGMLALLGADDATAEEIARDCELAVANDNCPGQIVLSGPAAGLDAAEAAARERKIKFARLAVDGPFHSPLMEPAADALRAALREVRFRPPSRPVFSGVTGRPFDDVPRRLAESLVTGVRWRAITHELARLGATRLVEVAPGKVLTNLAKRMLPDVERVAVERTPIGAAA